MRSPSRSRPPAWAHRLENEAGAARAALQKRVLLLEDRQAPLAKLELQLSACHIYASPKIVGEHRRAAVEIADRLTETFEPDRRTRFRAHVLAKSRG